MVDISVRHGHHTDGDDSGGNANIAKATAMVCLFAGSFIIGNIPIKLSRMFNWKGDARSNKHVKFLLGLGGGVLMCTTFIHLLPEVSESFEDFDIDIDVEIPFAELLMCIGFFVMYLVEESVHLYLHRKEKMYAFREIRKSLSIRRGELDDVNEIVDSLESPKSLVQTHDHNPHLHHVDHSHVHHSHAVHDFSEHGTVKTIRGLLIVLALSVHELFEGLAVGLESGAATVWYMFGAVSAHKFVIAFCIGVELVTSLKTKLVVIYVFTFAVVSPLGIGIGMIVTNMEHDSTAVASVILQGLATGTLLYVVFFEILQGDKKSGLIQYSSVFIGFAIMFTITTVLSV
ncbi:zinc transporter ZIP1 [Anoplophora glabripennis]|uniref:zinc transporter ZIP1 n=1 Tax=Anoplophora glabripennis TaxID=217634 RepID=UPI00087584A1|nr:zinc transporter ZIP1 [Anoplophora glabripennis]